MEDTRIINQQTLSKLIDLNKTGQEIKFARRVSRIVLINAAFAILIFTTALIFHQEWQLTMAAAAFTLTAIISGLQITEIDEKNYTSLTFGLLVISNISFIVFALVFQNAGILAAALILFSSMTISSSLFPKRVDQGITIGIISATLAALFTSFSPIPQLIMPAANLYLLILTILVFVVLILMARAGLLITNLRIKLVFIALAITLLPLVFISLVETSFLRNIFQEQTNQALLLAANQTASKLDEFLDQNRDSIANEADLPALSKYLLSTPDEKSTVDQELILTFDSLKTKENAHLFNYGLLDQQGENVFDTNTSRIGSDESNTEYFVQPLQTGQAYISEVRFNQFNHPHIYFSAPVRDDQNRIIGVLRQEYDALVLQKILEDHQNLIGSRSHPILVTDFQLRIADTFTPNLVYKTIVPPDPLELEELIANHLIPEIRESDRSTNLPEFAAGIENFQETEFFTAEMHVETSGIPALESAAVVRLSNQPWHLVFLREQTSLLQVLTNQTRLFTLIAVLVAGLIGMVVTALARIFSRPIIEMQTTAEEIARGNLDSRVLINTSDEIGALASAFNSMTDQLENSITELEDRVAERTIELARQNEALLYRSSQLKTVAEVARSIVSVQELEDFLASLTRLISERFNFYHVGIFLVDRNKEYAVLRAANSEGGRKMLARNHKLLIGRVGIVGHAAGVGEARIATDVGHDAEYFNNPDLPLTRSEMALPLIANNEIIGVLDVQSTESNAFSTEDIELFRTLADQVAIAILSNRLFLETKNALQETERLHRQYLEQEWRKEIQNYHDIQIVYSDQGLQINRRSLNPEIAGVIKTGEPRLDRLETEENSELSMVVPIKLRGQSIGAIKLRDIKPGKTQWSKDELAVVQSIADQVGLALENARLFEQTVRRANRERKALEITSKIRQSNDPQDMLQIAVQELQNALGTTKAQIILKAREETHTSSVEPGTTNHPGMDITSSTAQPEKPGTNGGGKE